MVEDLRIVGLSGSLRRESLNTAVLAELLRLAPEAVSIEKLEYHDVPLYNADLGELSVVEELKGRVAQADAVLIVSPEYNYGIPGPLKNLLDWLSRPGYKSVFVHKPVGILSASPGALGGARGQAHLKLVLGALLSQLFPHPDVTIGDAASRIAGGQVTDERTRAFLRDYLEKFSAWARRLK